MAGIPHPAPNALAGVSLEELPQNVKVFAQEKGLPDDLVPILQKGATLARSPADYADLKGLTHVEKGAIGDECNGTWWCHPWPLYRTIFFCSMAAVTQGWNQTGSNGANLTFPSEFGILASGPNAARNSWIVGVVNAAPYLGSAACGCWISDPLNYYLGRRGTIFVAALILIATPIASGFTHTWQTLFVIRLILGIGMGAKASTTAVYAAENSPAQIRGAVVMGWQLFTAFGIFIGFAANVIVENTGNIAWRLQLGSAFIPAVPLAIGIFFCPESPRWFMRHNRYLEAYDSLCKLRPTELQAARDLYYIYVQLEEEKHWTPNQGSNYFVRFAELFTIPRIRRATLAAFVVMLAQQMCGINIIAFYSSTVFSQAGYSDREALFASLGFGAVNFVFAFPALYTIDNRLGRRSLLLLTFPVLACTSLAAGLCFWIDPNVGTAHIGTIAFFIFLFAVFYSPGEGPVPFCYSAEIFPLTQREQGMAFAVTNNLAWAAVLSITFPRMLLAFTPAGAFGFYAGLNVLAFALIFLFVPETKQLTLEELDQVFCVPVYVFARHQVRDVLPYFINRWIFFKRSARLAPFYPWEN